MKRRSVHAWDLILSPGDTTTVGFDVTVELRATDQDDTARALHPTASCIGSDPSSRFGQLPWSRCSEICRK
jgi:hypothetical protein